MKIYLINFIIFEGEYLEKLLEKFLINPNRLTK